ncbi:alginate lyase [Arcticibacter tournemirensis]|uniref:Alginate lyase family protein n=1 Tax=Arcticibacter tournemirensis TaxID=699437 RepID=A0A5M9H7G2_9SPHI|nr:heparinase II/III family protein [Arcticibacter tournemirensis]KAA8482229.1 alginate lyase family protein [Arcticibacter tournemirensis]TQM52368.1 alginate lyase [Arcticibacter tournemirensis]
MNYLKKVVLVIFCLQFSLFLAAQEHPNIMLTKAGIDNVRKGCTQYPLLQQSFAQVKDAADKAVEGKINIPVPKDGGGGPSHEQHKRNYQNVLACGVAYQISGDAKYASYVRDVLLGYAAQYEKWLVVHPKSKASNQAGRIFWQILNDCVWQVNVIQGYDMVYDAITPRDRKTIENKLFVPVLKFITENSKETFNRIHNHGTWAVAAVGLTGYVLNKPDYVEMALKGSDKSGKTGYLAQLDQLFSPDGYYTEGPYYQRYALLPFVIFAKAINQYQPERHIYEYRNKVLEKAINTSLQSTYSTGVFFPINDAIKDKTFESAELVYGVDLIYAEMGGKADLLDVAQKQGRVIVSDAGLKVAKDITEGKAKPFQYKSLIITDGAAGNEGGLAVLRSGSNNDQQCLVFKAASQGMGHGHFDRLNILYYDNGSEVFSDYGAARFINIESKNDGEYLPENKTWAKQTVAHNTLVVDKTSAFKANLNEAQSHYPEILYFKGDGEVQAVSAREDKAFPGVSMVRTSVLLHLPELTKALLVDVYKAESSAAHTYDLPFWYNGYVTDASFKINAFTDQLRPAGTKYGYEHLWMNSNDSVPGGSGYITVMNNKRFYTTHFAGGSVLNVKTVSLGANDPNYNLLNAKAFILSRSQSHDQTFISITESHGLVDAIAETTTGAKSTVSGLKVIKADRDGTSFSFEVQGKVYQLIMNYTDKNNFIQLIK